MMPSENILTVSNAMFDILQENLQSHPFLMSQNFKMQCCQSQWCGAKWIKSIFRDIRGMYSGTRFETPLYYVK